MAELLLPVSGYSGLSSWQAHINRGTPSTEPGTDFYVPIGTPVYAPSGGVIWGYGTSIGPATGRWVGVNFFNGMSFRAMHMSSLVRTGGTVAAGELIAYSGASGYGEEDWSWNVAETGGAHTHVTLWPTHEHRYGYRSNGEPYTVDFMNYAGGFAGGDSTFFDPEEDDMTPEQDARLTQALQYASDARYALFYGGSWVNTDGTSQGVNYGVLPIVIHNQQLIAQNAGELAAIKQVVTQLSAGSGVPLDMAAIEAAAERGAREAIGNLKMTVEQISNAVNDEADDRARERLAG